MTISLPTAKPLQSKWQELEHRWADENPIGTAIPAYTENELAEEFVRWGTPLDGQEYVWKARRGPSRKVRSRIGNVITHFSSRKMQRRIATESRKAEFGAVVRYEFDGSTREYHCQPPQVRVTAETQRKRPDGTCTIYQAPSPYTPDILRLTPYGIYVDEWKTERDLEKLCEKFPNRFFKDEEGTWRCPERETHFAAMGITFCLRSANENGSVFVSNLEFLDDFFSGRTAPLTENAWRAIEKITGTSCPLTLALLLTHAYPDETPWHEKILVETPPDAFLVDDVYKAIAEQRLFVDLEYDDLSEARDVIVCNSRPQLEALQLNRPASKSVTVELTLNVDIGTEFMFKGRAEVFEVSFVNAETVHFFDQYSRNGG